MSLSHPTFKRPACAVTLVRGAPGSGKTTLCKKIAGPDDVVIDLDDCFTEVCGIHGHDAPARFFEGAIRVRNRKIDGLSGKTTGRAFLIVGCPSDREAEWWVAALGCEVVTLDPPLWEIEARDVSPSRKRLAAKWHHSRMVNDWRPPNSPRIVGPDGY